jgi:hypothetical protein
VIYVGFSLAVNNITKKYFEVGEIFLTFEVLFVFLYHLTMTEQQPVSLGNVEIKFTLLGLRK